MSPPPTEGNASARTAYENGDSMVFIDRSENQTEMLFLSKEHDDVARMAANIARRDLDGYEGTAFAGDQGKTFWALGEAFSLDTSDPNFPDQERWNQLSVPEQEIGQAANFREKFATAMFRTQEAVSGWGSDPEFPVLRSAVKSEYAWDGDSIFHQIPCTVTSRTTNGERVILAVGLHKLVELVKTFATDLQATRLATNPETGERVEVDTVKDWDVVSLDSIRQSCHSIMRYANNIATRGLKAGKRFTNVGSFEEDVKVGEDYIVKDKSLETLLRWVIAETGPDEPPNSAGAPARTVRQFCNAFNKAAAYCPELASREAQQGSQ